MQMPEMMDGYKEGSRLENMTYDFDDDEHSFSPLKSFDNQLSPNLFNPDNNSQIKNENYNSFYQYQNYSMNTCQPPPFQINQSSIFKSFYSIPQNDNSHPNCVQIQYNGQNMVIPARIKSSGPAKRWTPEEDKLLRDYVTLYGDKNWKYIAEHIPGRNATQCIQRWRKALAPGLRKGYWTPDEDRELQNLLKSGVKSWKLISKQIEGRTPKQCRERWKSHLNPNILKGGWTQEEDNIIQTIHDQIGNKWSIIAKLLPRRTENSVKIRWKSLARQKIRELKKLNKNKSNGNKNDEQQSVYGFPVGMSPLTAGI